MYCMIQLLSKIEATMIESFHFVLKVRKIVMRGSTATASKIQRCLSNQVSLSIVAAVDVLPSSFLEELLSQ
jgi:hypothetical protein